MYRDIDAAKDLTLTYKVVKIVRNFNTVAHELAALASRTGQSNVWSEPIPSAIQELAAHEIVMLPVTKLKGLQGLLNFVLQRTEPDRKFS